MNKEKGMIVNAVSEIASPSIFYHFTNFIANSDIYLMLEGLNALESIKLKTAQFLISELEQQGRLIRGVSKVIESSSGNLGIALSVICKERGYEFTCVTDPNILPGKEKRLQLLGANIIKVSQRDSSGGYLATRINTILSLLAKDDRYVWTKRYSFVMIFGR
jgi:cysteine synthase A